VQARLVPQVQEFPQSAAVSPWLGQEVKELPVTPS